jgi:predicted Zn-dependent peptidase
VLDNGLALRAIPLPGTRALTALVAFEAGSRSERPSENGIAHFLEHLVFKGGEAYPTPAQINAAGEAIGARLDAWTAQDAVAFRIRARAEHAEAAIDLLTDVAGRPRVAEGDVERERGVVIQEIARCADRPGDRADDLIDAAAFGEHPMGRPILGTEERLRAYGRSDAIGFRDRCWSGQGGCALLVGNLDSLPDAARLAELFGRFPAIGAPQHFEPLPGPSARVLAEERDSAQSHLRLLYRPALEKSDPAVRAALTVLQTLVGGSQGSLLFEQIREERGLAYSVFAREHCFADGAMLQVSAGVESGKCAEAIARIRAIVAELGADGPAGERFERARFERARSYAAGRRVLAFENTDRVADAAAEAAILHGERFDPEGAIAALDGVGFDQVAAVARALGEAEPALAVVGPHSEGEFT